MSATLGTLLKELEPSLDVVMFETLDDCAQESSEAWNNAGTGHAANCELNYTPQRSDGSVDISKALEVNTEFDFSRQLWSYLVTKGAIPDPSAFIEAVPAYELRLGRQENVSFLRARYEAMSANHCYQGMEYSEDHGGIAGWVPLVMEGRDRTADRRDQDGHRHGRRLWRADASAGQPVAGATRFSLHYQHQVVDLDRLDDGALGPHRQGPPDRRETNGFGKVRVHRRRRRWLELLEKSKIPEGHGYGGFRSAASGCGATSTRSVTAITRRSTARPREGSPPMSVPHLDTRIIGGKRSLLFGPYAGFSSKFIKHGSYSDLFRSIELGNIVPMLAVARQNVDLEEYLIGQVLQTGSHQFAMLQQFFPEAQRQDWRKAVAGQRVQIIKPDPEHDRRAANSAPNRSAAPTTRSSRCSAPRPARRPRHSSRSRCSRRASRASWRAAGLTG